MDIPIQTVIIIAWVITVAFYGFQLIRISRKKGISIPKLMRISSDKSHSAEKAKRMIASILMASGLYILALILAYFVQWSS